jgi:hypothetical protein
MRGDEVVLKIVKGTILDLRGSIRASVRREDFDKIHRSVKQTVAEKVARHG